MKEIFAKSIRIGADLGTGVTLRLLQVAKIPEPVAGPIAAVVLSFNLGAKVLATFVNPNDDPFFKSQS
jgi:hypothetical protein